MTSRTNQVIALCIAFSLTAVVNGCGNTTNESVAANTGGVTPPSAPKTQKDFYEQLQAQTKAGKKSAKPSR